MPAISSRDVAYAERPNIRRFEHSCSCSISSMMRSASMRHAARDDKTFAPSNLHAADRHRPSGFRAVLDEIAPALLGVIEQQSEPSGSVLIVLLEYQDTVLRTAPPPSGLAYYGHAEHSGGRGLPPTQARGLY
jgi:hypothetical protein